VGIPGGGRAAQVLREADTADRVTLGESLSLIRSRVPSFLPGDAALFFLEPIVGPSGEKAPPLWLINAIRTTCRTRSPTSSKPPIRFGLSDQVTLHNAALLDSVDCDLERLIRAHSASTLGIGSEFCGVGELRLLLSRHPHSPPAQGTPHRGKALRLHAGAQHRRKGSRSGEHARRREPQISPAGTGEGQGTAGERLPPRFHHPLSAGFVLRIPKAMVQPLGLVQQWTVDETGRRKIKYRITQDLSFSADQNGDPKSVNLRVDMSAYAEMVYVWGLPRIIHNVVSLCGQNPGLLILISKYDYSDAYMHITHSAAAATQTIAPINGNTAYLSLQQTFGGSPNPPTWCMFSEIVTDLSNEIS
jgi:hypothetical protein